MGWRDWFRVQAVFRGLQERLWGGAGRGCRGVGGVREHLIESGRLTGSVGVGGFRSARGLSPLGSRGYFYPTDLPHPRQTMPPPT